MVTTRNVQLQAVLKDPTGSPVPNETYAFAYKLSADAAFTPAGTAVTDATGKANVVVPLAVPNSYDAQASFAGDANYDASVGTVTGFRVKSGTTTALVLVPQ